MRSLGYSPTLGETQQYFKKITANRLPGSGVDFAAFLATLHEHQQARGDPLIEIHQALRCADPGRTGFIAAGEFAAILASIGEKMTRPEIDAVLKQVGVVAGNRLPYEKLLRVLAAPPPAY